MTSRGRSRNDMELQNIADIAPAAFVALTIAGAAYWIGRRSQDDVIAVLREWLDELRRK